MYKSTPCDARRGRHNISCCMCPKHTFFCRIRRSNVPCSTGTSNHCTSKTYVQICHNGDDHAEHHGLPLQPWHSSIGISNRNTVSIRHTAARIIPLQTDQYIRHISIAPSTSAANLDENYYWEDSRRGSSGSSRSGITNNGGGARLNAPEHLKVEHWLKMCTQM